MKNHKILSGNELIIEGALEAGFSLFTGYPGSPLADYFNILHRERKALKERGIQVAIGNSEANAAAMASGAKMARQNVMVAMKSMGLHVAADALSVGNFADPGSENSDKPSGAVIVVGDDPWSISTSTPADSRYLYKHLHIPFFEPATPQELKDWVAKALELSQKSSVYTGILLTTFMAEGGGRVEVYPHPEIDKSKRHLDPERFDLQKNVMVPPNSLLADRHMISERFPRVYKILSEMALDRHIAHNSQIGIISSGATYETMMQVLSENALEDHFQIYKVATPYPLNQHQLVPFLKEIKILIVVEEKRDFLEQEIKNIINDQKLSVEVYGKKFPAAGADMATAGFPAFGGLNAEIISEKLDKLLQLLDRNDKNFCRQYSQGLQLQLPPRLPTFCPGCPHRETLSLLKDLRKTLKKKNMNLISHGDVGCYSLAFLEPFKEMHDLSAMGQGGAMASGTDIFSENPSLVLMGDSTFFHSGMTAISHSVQLNHNITYILLDNDNTAMTGHQATPATGLAVDGANRPKQKMLEVAKALKVDHAIEVNPTDRYFYRSLLQDFVTRPGVKVIVSNKECALTFHGRKKKADRVRYQNNQTQAQKVFYQINTFSCEDCRACVEQTGCPGLGQTFDAYGTRVMIDPQICVNDGYCSLIKACPSFEKVIVKDYHPTLYQDKMDKPVWQLPEPNKTSKTLEEIANGASLRIIVTGVGGSGVTTISRIIAEACAEMEGRSDINFKFVEQKGLAQRNGSVTAHLTLFAIGASMGPLVPVGAADLLLSPDLLEGARALKYLSASGQGIIDQRFQIPLSILLDRGEQASPINEQQLRQQILDKYPSQLNLQFFKDLSHQRLGKSVYASAMILGTAFQKGFLPFKYSTMLKAFERSVPKYELESNLQAFELGRVLIAFPETVQIADKEMTTDLSVYEASIREAFIFNWKEKVQLFQERFSKLKEIVNPDKVARYLHDIIVYDGGQKLEDYQQCCLQLASSYSNSELRELAICTLSKTFWVKDEVFVSHLMITPLKSKEDQKRYQHLGTGYTIERINRPAFTFFGKNIEFDLSPRTWMLKTMRHLRWLRVLMPQWHQKEREIALDIRTRLLKKSLNRGQLMALNNIKGYRNYRYEAYDEYIKMESR